MLDSYSVVIRKTKKSLQITRVTENEYYCNFGWHFVKKSSYSLTENGTEGPLMKF